MKLALAFVLLALASSISADNIDWSNVLPINQLNSKNPFSATTAIDPRRRIVNGTPAQPHQFPYQCALLIVTTTGAGLCGASVISENAVLTAAHCTSAAVTEYLIIAGAYNRVQVEPQQQRRFVPTSAFIPHPDYSVAFLWNDVAVIRVGTPFVFNQFVSPIILASDDSERHVDAEVTVSGFGRYSDSHSRTSEVVLYTRKVVITNAQCANLFRVMVIDSTICAIGDPLINNAVCNGDSGGPLSIIRNNESYQVGIVSFGSPLGCERGVPDGYARVSSFNQWIRQVAGMN